MRERHASFKLKNLTLTHALSPFKIGTDALLLAGSCRQDSYTHVLDLCAGCGIIGFMIASKYHPASLSLVEIDGKACEEIGLNACQNKLESITTIINADITQRDQIPLTGGTFDLITCNPPYFIDSLVSNSHRKTLARHAEESFPEQLISTITHFLHLDGQAHLIIPIEVEQHYRAAMANNRLFVKECISIRPLPGKPIKRRILVATTQVQSEDHWVLTIQNTINRKDWTQQYKDWMASFQSFDH